jgi:hypothetical protein
MQCKFAVSQRANGPHTCSEQKKKTDMRPDPAMPVVALAQWRVKGPVSGRVRWVENKLVQKYE